MLIYLNRILIIIDSLLKYIFNKTNKCKNTKNILIVFQQVFGDSVLIQKSLTEYTKIFPHTSGYNVTMLIRPSVHKFMSETMPLPDEINFDEIDFKLFLENYAYYKKTISKYNNKIYTIIVPGTSFSAEVFSVACNAKRKIGIIRNKPLKKPFLMSFYNKIAYNETVKQQKDEMVLQCHKRLINYLGNTDYKVMLPDLKQIGKFIDDNNYCVFCIGASVTDKCWAIEKFAVVADYIIENYNMNIHICGGAEDSERVKQFINSVKYKNRIFSHVGNTTFAEWVSVIQNASLLVSNDSATAHIGAAVRCKSVIITGMYDGKYVFPYNIDFLNKGDILPKAVYTEMPCNDCRSKGYFIGSGNTECMKRIKNGKCTLCIDAITVDNVIDTINELMK